MGSNYVSPEERAHLAKNKASKALLDSAIHQHNFSVIGAVKEHKGVHFRMLQNGTFICVNVSPDSQLQGYFNSAQGLKKLIDDLDRAGSLLSVFPSNSRS